jgi:hypothetical protein
MLFIVILTVLFVTAHAALTAEISPSAHIGFGAQKLRRFRSKGGLLASLQSTSCENVTEHYFSGAVLDNFAPIEYQQFWTSLGQRYFLNKQFWGGENYPIFVFIGGEGEETCSRLTDRMYAFDVARQHQALLVNVEHRFYGKSIPTVDTSTKVHMQHHSLFCLPYLTIFMLCRICNTYLHRKLWRT